MATAKKIRIAALTTISNSMDWFIVDSMRNLAKNGYEVILICNMDDEFVKRNSDFAKCINLPMRRGISVRELVSHTLHLRRIFKDEKVDMIYYMSPNASMYASVAGWLVGVKTRVYSQCGLRYVSFDGIKRKVFKLVEKMTCSFSTHIRSQSRLNMELAISEKLCKKEKISVIGIGGTVGVELHECRSFDHEKAKRELREKYGIPQDAFVYGYVGRLNTDKGVNELIEAFCEVMNSVPNSYLVLVGMMDDNSEKLKKNLELVQESENMVMTGMVPFTDVYPHMAMFDVLVHPTYREGFGKVLQEAMGVGIPIITTDVPGPSEVIENNVSGILCRAKDPTDLAEKMILLYSDPELCKRFVESGTQRAEKYFDRPIMVNNILQDMNAIIHA